MAYNVKFLKGTSTAYASITKDANTFYYTTDDNQFYLGSIKLSNAGEIAAAVTRIGANEDAISALQAAINLLNDSDDTKSGTIAKMIKDAIDSLDGSLAAIAKSGAAEDVSITDEDDNFTATNVEGALAELVDMVETGGAGSVVSIAPKSTANEGYLKTYVISQGGTSVGEIDIPKDLVVSSGSIVENPQGQDAGTYIELVIANQANPLYINVADLVDVYTPQANASQIQLAIDSSNVISGSIVAGSVDATALASSAVTTGKIADGNVTEAKLASSVTASLAKADSAVQSVVEGDGNGQIKVDGTNVDVHGLGSAAYQPATAFDAAGAADAVLGEATDGASVNTVYGAKAAAAAAQTAADQANNAIAALDVTDTAIAGQYVSAVSQENGSITVTRADLPDYSNTYDALGAADTAEANAKAYTDTALSWGTFN